MTCDTSEISNLLKAEYFVSLYCFNIDGISTKIFRKNLYSFQIYQVL